MAYKNFILVCGGTAANFPSDENTRISSRKPRLWA